MQPTARLVRLMPPLLLALAGMSPPPRPVTPPKPAYEIIDLGTLGGDGSSGRAINAKGQVTGVSCLKGGSVERAFLYDGKTMKDLGTLGGKFSDGKGINNQGQVIGEALLADGSRTAFLYTKGKMIDLNTLLPAGTKWRLGSADGINDKGWITGSGTNNGLYRAYILRPVEKG